MNVIAYQDLRKKTVEIGLYLTCQTDWLSAKSPNEWGSWEILPFITLSQVTQHSEHFPKTQVPTGGKKRLCIFVQTYVHTRVSTYMCMFERVSLQVDGQFPKPGLFSIMFYASLLLNQSGAWAVLPNIVFPLP